MKKNDENLPSPKEKKSIFHSFWFHLAFYAFLGIFGIRIVEAFFWNG